MTPRELLQDVARAVTAAGLRAVVDRAPDAWRAAVNADPSVPYAVVTLVVPLAPGLRGDGRTIAEEATVQVSTWETRAAEDPLLLASVRDALDGVRLAGHSYTGTVVETFRLPDPAADLIQHAVDVRYSARR